MVGAAHSRKAPGPATLILTPTRARNPNPKSYTVRSPDSRDTLGIQIAQCWKYLQTSGPNLCIICILGSLGIADLNLGSLGRANLNPKPIIPKASFYAWLAVAPVHVSKRLKPESIQRGILAGGFSNPQKVHVGTRPFLVPLIGVIWPQIVST